MPGNRLDLRRFKDPSPYLQSPDVKPGLQADAFSDAFWLRRLQTLFCETLTAFFYSPTADDIPQLQNEVRAGFNGSHVSRCDENYIQSSIP